MLTGNGKVDCFSRDEDAVDVPCGTRRINECNGSSCLMDEFGQQKRKHMRPKDQQNDEARYHSGYGKCLLKIVIIAKNAARIPD